MTLKKEKSLHLFERARREGKINQLGKEIASSLVASIFLRASERIVITYRFANTKRFAFISISPA